MTMHNKLPNEIAAVIGVIDPDAYAAAAYTPAAYADCSNFHAIQAIIKVGDIVATGTVDAAIYQATDSAGTGSKIVTGTAITQLTQAGSDSNKQAIIDLACDQLDHENGFKFATVKVTLGTAGADMDATLLGFRPRRGPASDNDLATVDEIVTLPA